jgi:hypothetical protein
MGIYHPLPSNVSNWQAPELNGVYSWENQNEMVDVLTRHVWLAEGTQSEWAIFVRFSANINVGKMSFWTEAYQIWAQPIFKQTQVLWEFLSFKQMPREWQNLDEIRLRMLHRATSLTPWDELRILLPSLLYMFG